MAHYATEENLKLQIAALNKKIDFILNHLGITYEKDDYLEQVRLLINQGNKIEAVKRYRQLTGLGLAEAKQAVDNLERGFI